MYNGKVTSLKNILWKVLNNPLAAQLTYDQAAEFALEAIGLVGSPLGYIDKVTDPPISITNKKGALPIDLEQVRGIRIVQDESNHDNQAVPLLHTTDLYDSTSNCSTDGTTGVTEFTYRIQNGVITTSFDEGLVEVAYKALPVDEDGYPLIPDNPKYKFAVEYFILFRFLEPLWTIGKITDKAFNYIDTKKCFYIGAAQTSMQLAGIDHLQTMMNSVNRLIINDTTQQNFYKFFGQKEIIKRYH